MPTPERFIGYTKTKVRNALYDTAIFAPVQSVYHRIFNPAAAARRAEMRKFYRQFMTNNDLVFDVGANVGEYAEIFSSLGAKVIAMEPNPDCCETLHKLARRSDVKVEQCAVGNFVGTIGLNICQESHLSTVSEQWLEQTRDLPSLPEAKWLNTIEVPILTLDALAERHGIPRFVKIDVEGFEEQVLSGMSFLPDVLSFEFHHSTIEAAASCLEQLKSYGFNLIFEWKQEFVFPAWVSSQEVLNGIASLGGEHDFGDVFAQRQQ